MEFLVPSSVSSPHLLFAWQELDLRGPVGYGKEGTLCFYRNGAQLQGGVHAGQELFYIHKDHSGCCAVKAEKKQGFPLEGGGYGGLDWTFSSGGGMSDHVGGLFWRTLMP